jgi:hypothetical protein
MKSSSTHAQRDQGRTFTREDPRRTRHSSRVVPAVTPPRQGLSWYCRSMTVAISGPHQQGSIQRRCCSFQDTAARRQWPRPLLDALAAAVAFPLAERRSSFTGRPALARYRSRRSRLLGPYNFEWLPVRSRAAVRFRRKRSPRGEWPSSRRWVYSSQRRAHSSLEIRSNQKKRRRVALLPRDSRPGRSGAVSDTGDRPVLNGAVCLVCFSSGMVLKLGLPDRACPLCGSV